MNRFTIEEYGCFLALAGKTRSEDPFTNVAAVAISKDKRILGIAYNGLAPGMVIPEWMKLQENRIKKSEYFRHAEQNLFSLLKNEECHTLCTNISPCISCCQTISAHNVKRVIYLKEYHGCKKFKDFFNFYNIEHFQLPVESKNKILQYINNPLNFQELIS